MGTDMDTQADFDLVVGQLDRVLSRLVLWGKEWKHREQLGGLTCTVMDQANAQTLKHHAEDMVAAGQKILRDLGEGVEGTPQPG